MSQFELGQRVVAVEDFEAWRKMGGGSRMYLFKEADIKNGMEAIVTGFLDSRTLFHVLDYGLVIPLEDENWEVLKNRKSIRAPIRVSSFDKFLNMYGRDLSGSFGEDPPVTVVGNCDQCNSQISNFDSCAFDGRTMCRGCYEKCSE